MNAHSLYKTIFEVLHELTILSFEGWMKIYFFARLELRSIKQQFGSIIYTDLMAIQLFRHDILPTMMQMMHFCPF